MTSDQILTANSNNAADDPMMTIETEHVDTAEVIRVHGRLNWATVAGLRAVATDLCNKGPVVIDLTGLEGSDSAATASLLSILVRAHELGQKVALALTDDVLRTILMSVEAHLLAPIAASETEALASLGLRPAA